MPASTNQNDPASAAERQHALLARVVTESTQALAICEVAREAREIAFVNQEFERLTGWTLHASVGRSLDVLLRPPGGQFEWERIAGVMTGHTAWRRSIPAARRDGTVFWADLHLYPLKDDQGTPTHWVCTLSDVTENLELHDALHRSEQQHRLLAENLRDLIMVCREDERIAFVSSSCTALLGYAPEAMVGMPLRNFVHPDDHTQFEHVFRGHFEDRSESVVALRMQRKNGEYVWTEITSKTRRDPHSHRATEVVSSIRDITKRRHAEENLRAMHKLLDAVYDAVPIGLGLLDAGNQFIQCNRAFAQILGLTPADVAGRAADTLLPATDLTRATIAQGSVCESECSDVNGGVIPAELSVIPLNAAGSAPQRLVILTDLRERRKMEQRVREASQLESLGTLAGGIAHDFNNMLAIVLGYASLLRDAAGDPPRIMHYADTIIDAGKRGADVVRQLQLFASTQDAELAPINMHTLLEDSVSRARETVPGNVQLVTCFSAADPVLTADAHQLTQAVQKLLQNAFEAMPEGGRVTVRTSEVRQAHFSPGSSRADQKTFLRVSVEDNGRGMDAATRARMFEPFFARNKGPETRGLGLAVVYGIMRAHRGLIEVDSAPGQGTTVHLLFPRATSRAEFTTPPFAEPFNAAAERRTILLVEDEQDIGALWLEILPTDGWRVLWARDGGEALRLFRAHREEIALVFTDIGLPVLDGWQVAETVRREAPGMPLLIASGAFRSGDRQRGIPEPVAYLSKPYVPSKVIKQIRTLAPRANSA